MARTLPTEESLGLSPTEDELNTSYTPPDDDVSIGDDADHTPPDLAKPGDDKTPALADAPADDAAKPADTPKAEDPKMVDVRAVQEARAEARAAKQQAALLEQRWNDFLAYQQAPKQAEPEKQAAIPGPEDPMGRLNWTTEQLAAMQEQQQTTAREQAEAQRAQQEFDQAFARVDADYRAASAADPTLTEAYNALRKSQGEELLAMGYSIPQAREVLDKTERDHVLYVASRGISIADHIRNLATARGWRPAAPAQQQAPAPQKTDIAAVAAAQQRHQSLSDAPGGDAVAPLDAKALARMSDKDFKAWMSKKGNEAKFDEIMGR